MNTTMRTLLSACLALAAGPAMAAGGPSWVAASERLAPQALQATLAFWTPQRIAAAWEGQNMPARPQQPPLDPAADQSGYVASPEPYAEHALNRVTGALFYVAEPIGGTGTPGEPLLAHCSASAVASDSGSLIVTAAHCLSGSSYWFHHVLFVPALSPPAVAGDAVGTPLGRWPVQQMFVPWLGVAQQVGQEIGVARVALQPQGTAGCQAAGGCTLQSVLGAVLEPHISTTALPERLTVIGYPGVWQAGDGPYALATMRQCESHTAQPPVAGAITLLNCAVQGGNSGGPLLQRDATAPAGARLWGVVSGDAGQTRLGASTFLPVYEAADSAW